MSSTSKKQTKKPADKGNEDTEISEATTTPPADKEGDNIEPSVKRVKVSASDPTREIEDQRRGKIKLNKEQRDVVIRWILACHIHITGAFVANNEEKTAALLNIHVSEQISSIFATAHTCLRQESLSTGNLRSTMEGKSYTIQSEGNTSKELSHEFIVSLVKEIATNFKLVYSKPKRDDNNHWYGTAAPIISLINMFKVRLTELRIGHGSFTVQKDAKVQRVVSTDEYGLKNVHRPLLEGIKIPPEKKSGMAQSLGPMTSLICLARSDNDQKYSKRWRSAVKRNFSFLPEIDSVIETCCGKSPHEVKGLSA